MRLLALAAAMMVSVLSLPTWAANVAVADSQAAVSATEFSKKTFDKLNTDMKPQRDRLDQLRKEIAAMQDKFNKNGSIMSDKERGDLQKQAQSKVNEFEALAQSLQKRAQEVQQDMVQKMYPKMEKVVEEIRKAGNYDIIIEKKNVIWADANVDITKQIVDKLNVEMASEPVSTTPSAGKK